MANRSTPTVSIAVPIYNERETLPALFARLVGVMDRCADTSFEVLLVDDGSSDGSDGVIDEICGRDPRFYGIHLSRNFGHQAALQAGLDAAGGAAVVLMDGDLQDPPEMLETFLDHWRQGYDVVYAVRRSRQDAGWKRATARLFYRSLRVMSELDLALDAGDFCLMDRRVVDALADLPERNRFLRGLRTWIGFKQIGIPFDRPARQAGSTKYTLRKLTGLALAGYVGFSAMPLRLATGLGLVCSSIGALLALWAVAATLFGGVAAGTEAVIAAVLFVGGIQLVMLGILGEYLGRVHEEVLARPLYVVRTRVGGAGAQTELASWEETGRPEHAATKSSARTA